MATASSSLRSAVAGLNSAASRDLSALWREVESAAQASTALRDVLPALVDQYGAAAATLAAEWYDDLRDKAGRPGRFSADPADIPETGTQSLVGWALNEATDYSAFQTLILGGTQRRIANFSRLTVVRASTTDPHARGWQRTGVGDCDWCAMLIGRGAVYSAETADFQAHDHCQCGAEPSWT